ncbi:MAG: hypothetical protein RR346_00285 [Bacteroidales bacterium]
MCNVLPCSHKEDAEADKICLQAIEEAGKLIPGEKLPMELSDDEKEDLKLRIFLSLGLEDMNINSEK